MSIKNFTITSLFLSIIFLFSFTPLGYVHLLVVKATLVHVPVIIGALLLGPKIGALLGFSFGMTSIISNTLAPTLLSFMFSPLVPVIGSDKGSLFALVVAFVPRILVGILPYFIMEMMHRIFKNTTITKRKLFTTAFLTTAMHTFLVLSGFLIFFNDSYRQAVGIDSLSGAINALFGIFLTNGLTEAFVAGILTVAIVPPLLIRLKS